MVRADQGKTFFTRVQKREEDIPRIRIDIHGGRDHHERMFKIMRDRQMKISPILLALLGVTVPTCPLPNPLADPNNNYLRDPDAARFSSNHIVNLWSSRDRHYELDLLIRDDSLYFVAFRRHVLDLLGNRGGDRIGPGTWFVFKDQKDSLPSFINAVEVDMSSSYEGKVSVGGDNLWLHMLFHRLTKYELVPHVTPGFRAAVYSFIAVYCEVRRSLCMRNLVFQRMDDHERASAIPTVESRIKNMWDTLSGEALTAKLRHTLLEGRPLAPCCSQGGLNFTRMEQLIGPQGELLCVKLDLKVLLRYMTEKKFLKEAKLAQKEGMFPNIMFEEEEGGRGEQEQGEEEEEAYHEFP